MQSASKKRNKYFFVVNVTDALLNSKAKELKMTTYDMRHNHFLNYNTLDKKKMENIIFNEIDITTALLE